MGERAFESPDIGLSARLEATLPRGTSTLLRFLRKKPLGAAGGMIIGGFSLVAFAAGLGAPYDPLETDFGAMLGPPVEPTGLGPMPSAGTS